MSVIPETHADLLTGPVVVSLVTVMPDGQPQATPVWCSYDGQHILFNTAEGRQKDKNLQDNPRVTVLAVDPNNPYRWIEVRGQVTERTTEGAVDHINQLSALYRGIEDYYSGNPGMRGKETRVIFRIQPEKINSSPS